MWKAFKAMPLIPKVLILVLVVGVAYKLTHLYRGPSRPHAHADFGDTGSEGGTGGGQSGYEEQGGGHSSQSRERQQMLAQFQAKRMEITRQVQQCLMDTQRYQQAAAAAAMNGGMVSPPVCSQYMAQWAAQQAYYETEVYKLQGGDPNASVRQVTGIAPDSGYSPGSRSASGGTGNPDDAIDAVDNYDRGSIRGTSMYTDQDGENHELATRNYYFRDRSSGAMVGSDSPNPPNDGRDYEPLQMNNHPH